MQLQPTHSTATTQQRQIANGRGYPGGETRDNGAKIAYDVGVYGANAHLDVTQYLAAERRASIDAAHRYREALRLQRSTQGSLTFAAIVARSTCSCEAQWPEPSLGTKTFSPFRWHLKTLLVP